MTANVRAVTGVPTLLRGEPGNHPDLVELRGEVYVDAAEFARLNAGRRAEGAEPFAHPRNLAAGTLQSLDPAEIADRDLSVVIYGWGAWEGGVVPSTQQAFHAQVKAWGLPGVEEWTVVRSAAEAWQAVQAFGQSREQREYPVDGVVLKLDEVALRSRLGESAQAPRWAIACKFAAERVVTRVRAITIQIGRTGVLTPVAELEPVTVGGTTIARATLHNREALARRDVRVGDFVEIEKAGEVIPAVAAVRLDRRPEGTSRYEFPGRCPACATPVEGKTGEATVRCPNFLCPAQQQRRLEHFASAAGVGIRGLGPALIASLVDAGLVRTPADLYRLRSADLAGVPGIGPARADKLLEAIAASRRSELWRFIHGLGIPRIGAANARKLAAACGSLTALAQLDDARQTEIVGVAAAGSLQEYLDRPENQADLATLQSVIQSPVPVEEP